MNSQGIKDITVIPVARGLISGSGKFTTKIIIRITENPKISEFCRFCYQNLHQQKNV